MSRRKRNAAPAARSADPTKPVKREEDGDDNGGGGGGDGGGEAHSAEVMLVVEGDDGGDDAESDLRRGRPRRPLRGVFATGCAGLDAEWCGPVRALDRPAARASGDISSAACRRRNDRVSLSIFDEDALDSTADDD
eukprot:ctg_4879.g591